jgi:hypothetical protein
VDVINTADAFKLSRISEWDSVFLLFPWLLKIPPLIELSFLVKQGLGFTEPGPNLRVLNPIMVHRDTKICTKSLRFWIYDSSVLSFHWKQLRRFSYQLSPDTFRYSWFVFV